MVEPKVCEPNKYLTKGYLSVANGDACKIITDITKVFGVRDDIVIRGYQRTGGAAWGNKLIWWPKSDMSGEDPNATKGWHNDFQRSNTVIYEWNDDPIETQKRMTAEDLLDRKRIVFKHQSLKKSGYCYQFIGLFSYDAVAARKSNKLVWRRVKGVDQIVL